MEWPAHLPLVGGGGVSISIFGLSLRYQSMHEEINGYGYIKDESTQNFSSRNPQNSAAKVCELTIHKRQKPSKFKSKKPMKFYRQRLVNCAITCLSIKRI